LEIPLNILGAMRAVFSPYIKHQLESACFWYGTLDAAGNGAVKALVIPAQSNTWGNFHVEPGAIQAMSRATKPQGWRNLAQIHTHPGTMVEHSSYDDVHANSRNALSIVIPHYGQWDGAWPESIGVHEHQGEGWHLLSDAEAAVRTRIVPAAEIHLLDGRPHA
jgi:hypothetical protein